MAAVLLLGNIEFDDSTFDGQCIILFYISSIENPCSLKNPELIKKIGILLNIEEELVSKALRFVSR